MTEILKSVIAAIGIDIGKNSFHVVGLDGSGGSRASAEVVAWAGGSTPRQYGGLPDRHGGLSRGATALAADHLVWIAQPWFHSVRGGRRGAIAVHSQPES